MYGCIQAKVKLRETRVTQYCDWHMRNYAKRMPFALVTYQRVGLDVFHIHRDERRSDLMHALKHQWDVLAVDDAYNKQCTGGRGCLECQVILHAYRDQVQKAVQNVRMNKGVCKVRDRYLRGGAVRRQVSFNDGLFLVLEFHQAIVVRVSVVLRRGAQHIESAHWYCYRREGHLR